MKKQRSPGLIAIVVYKSFVASLLTVSSITLLLAQKNHQVLDNFSESFLETKLNLIEFLLDKVLLVSPKTLLLSGIAAALYAVLTAVEAGGLWYEKGWETILVLMLVGISIPPPEIYKLVQGVTILKLGVFIANVAVLWYLLHHLPKHAKDS